MQQHLPIGHTLQNSKYHILKVLGQGGFGVTYLAQHILLGQVVVKELFLHNNCSRGQDGCTVLSMMEKYAFDQFKDRFLEEARMIVKFKDVEGIVKTFDFFEENNTVYFAMEYVNASSLADYVHKMGALSEAEALDYIHQVSNSLEIVHQQGVLHRDIKPHNILLTREGKTVLIDFGIARNYAEGQTAFHTTFFTPRYAAPEQMTESDKRGAYTDTYSLGATLYYLLTATHPQTLGEISINGFIEAKSIKPNISDETNFAITTAMKLRREERFQTINEWKKALPLDKYVGKQQADNSFAKPNFQQIPPQNPQNQSVNAVQTPTITQTPENINLPPKAILPKKDTKLRQRQILIGLIFLGLFMAGFMYQAWKDSARERRNFLRNMQNSGNKERIQEPYVMPNKQMEVEFVKNELAMGLIPENLEGEFSKYDDSYSCTIKGYLKLEKIEVAKLALKMEFLGENGQVLATENQETLTESDAMLRAGDLLPIKFLKYEEGKIPNPYTKARITVSYARKTPAAPNYSRSKTVAVTYLNGESENMKIEARERKSNFTDALNGNETYHQVEWEFENIGNSAIKTLKINAKYFDKAGKLLDQESRYALTDGDPLLLRGQTRVLGTTLGFKGKRSELARYELEVEDMR